MQLCTACYLCQCLLGLCLLVGLGRCCDFSLDTCGGQAPGDVLIGVMNPYHAKVEALHRRTKPERFNCTEPPVKVIIGPRYSEESIPVARLLGLYMVPQISSTSSASILSDKTRFPSFLRPIPSDEHQTQALAKLMSRLGWDWIGVVSGDDDYGKAALQGFLLDAEHAGVCVAFQEVVPHYLDHSNGSHRDPRGG
ncbi:hypothetical protein AAFF_G00254230 [Aldrovandia affinis]|uniref:Receptor ligand binding region domain-containing protein n=1 Tax=Aldrovandia affinis TaxID=143900 RepID=A0AAD7W302_9TELE|nr:hypothetical protein AAFF_G00254230 [Aldrovandia affinis]